MITLGDGDVNSPISTPDRSARKGLMLSAILFTVLLAIAVTYSTQHRAYAYDFKLLWKGVCRFVNFQTDACHILTQEVNTNATQALTGNYVLQVYPAGLLLLFTPFALFSPEQGFAIFALLSIFFCGIGFYLCLQMFLEKRLNSNLFVAFSLTTIIFGTLPFGWAIMLGQQSPVIFLLMSIYLAAFHYGHSPISRGILLGILSVKPQSFILIYVLLLLNIRFKKIRQELLATGLSAMLIYGLAFTLQPDSIPRPNADSFNRALGFLQPNLGTWLEYFTGLRWLRVAPLGITVAILCYLRPAYSLRNIILYMLPLSHFVTPYCGSYDFLTLTPAMLLLGSKMFQSLSGSAAIVLLSVPMVLSWVVIAIFVGEAYLVWLPLCFLALAAVYERKTLANPHSQNGT